MRYRAILTVLLCAACSHVKAVPEPTAPCPIVSASDTLVPFTQYVTVVVDNKVVEWRTRQRVNGLHRITILDSVPDAGKYLTHFESVSILPPDSARLFDRCPGVRVLYVRNTRLD